MRRGWANAALLFAALAAAGAPAAHADEVDDVAQKVAQLASRVQEIDQGLKPPPPPDPNEADRRLVDAQVQYGLKNWGDASILLYDIVEKYPTSDAYAEALYYLGDTLYWKGDYLTARKYLEQLITGSGATPGAKVGTQSAHYQAALATMLEIAVKTRDPAVAQDALTRLSAIPQAQLDPLVPYARGKFAFAEGQYGQAVASFQGIPEGSPYYFRGRYFLGASYVAAGKLPEAAQIFADLTAVPIASADDQEIVDLAHLALGRVLYERGELEKAAHEYQSVSQHSSHFDDALYEIAWVYVKGGDYARAQRAIDLCLLADPGADTAAEAKLLEGNLDIRLAQEADSTDIFQKVKDEFGPMRDQLDAALKRQDDPASFFKQIVTSANPALDATMPGALPPLALKWIHQAEPVQRLTVVTSDEDQIKQDLADADTTLGRLEAVVDSPERVNIFPDLARARGESSTISNQLTLYRATMARDYHALVAPIASADEARQLDELETRRTQLDKDLANLPQSTDSLDARIAKEKARYEDLEQEQAKVRTTIDGLEAELVAIRKYYHDTQSQQHESQARFEADVAQVQSLVDQLNQSYNDLENAIEASKSSIGVMDEEGQAEAAMKAEYKDLIAKEEALEKQIDDRLSGGQRTKADEIDSVLDKITEAEGNVTVLNNKIDQLVDRELVDVKSEMADAKARIADYKSQLQGDLGETSTVGGELVARSAREVADKIYDIVVRADVGLVDVAWALKQQRVDAYKQVADEEARETKLLDEEYQEVLRDDSQTGAKNGAGGGSQ